MTIPYSDTTRMQAYQLRPGGARARMAILRMVSGGNWRAARQYTLGNWRDAFIEGLHQGFNGHWYWYTHRGEQFRNERDAREVVRSLPLGYYTDLDGDETAVGIVAMLTHGRYIAGYRWTANDERVYLPTVYDDESEAAHAADGAAERFADDCREDAYKFQAMCLCELDAEDKLTEVQKAFALRHHRKFGGADRVRNAIKSLRAARDDLKEATNDYEGI